MTEFRANTNNDSAGRETVSKYSNENQLGSEPCQHENPVCVCKTSDFERSTLLEEYLNALGENGFQTVRLLPLDEEGKRPIISGCCRLDSDEAESLLVDGETAVTLIEQDGVRGFCLYAGKSEHGTNGLVFTDHDDPDRFPADADTLTVTSGSGTGYHQTFENAGDVRNSKGKDELEDAGEVRANNQYVVLPGSIHPSGGIYHIESNPGIDRLESDNLPDGLLPRGEGSRTPNTDPPQLDTEVPDTLGEIDADFNVESRYQTMLDCSKSETIKAIIKGNLSETDFKNDRHQAEGWLAEQVGFYMGRDREVIDQVLMRIFTENPETDAHTDTPDKSSKRKYLQNDRHRNQVLDYATSKDAEYDPGLGVQRITRTERPLVAYPTVERVQEALSDLVLASKSEIVDHPRVDRGETQVWRALKKMMDSNDVPFNVETVQDGRRRYYYLETHSILIPKERREELGIEVGL